MKNMIPTNSGLTKCILLEFAPLCQHFALCFCLPMFLGKIGSSLIAIIWGCGQSHQVANIKELEVEQKKNQGLNKALYVATSCNKKSIPLKPY